MDECEREEQKDEIQRPRVQLSVEQGEVSEIAIHEYIIVCLV